MTFEPPWSIPQSPPQLVQTGSLTKPERRGRELCLPLSSPSSWARGGALKLPGWTSNAPWLGRWLWWRIEPGLSRHAPQVPEWSCIQTGFLTGEPLGLEDLEHSHSVQHRSRFSSCRVGVSSECRCVKFALLVRLLIRRRMAAGDDRIFKLAAARGPIRLLRRFNGGSRLQWRVSEEGSSLLKRRNLRCGGKAAAYTARHPPILHSHRLACRRWAIDSFF